MYIYRGKLNFKPGTGNQAENEGITVIFPSEFRLGEPVYTCWQWTTTSKGGKNQPYFHTGTIDEVAISSTCKIGFCYDDPYSFNATFSDDLKELSLIMQSADGNTSDKANLSLVYTPDPSASPDLSAPRIYIGKIASYAKLAVDEMLVVVSPGGMDQGQRICAFWQWTQSVHGTLKQNADTVSTIKDVKNVDHVGESFSFHHNDHDNSYTFDVTVREADDQLTLKMTDQQQVSTGDLTLDLQVADLSSKLPRLAVINRTTQVYNDTNEIVICALKSSGSGLTDQLLAAASLILGVVGLIASVPAAGVPAAVGLWMGTIGMSVSVGGAVQVFNSSGQDTSAIMFPGDTMRRTSSGSIVTSNNDLQIMLIRVHKGSHTDTTPGTIAPGSRLVLSTATVEKVGETTQDLSNLLPGKPLAPTYKQLLAIQLPAAIHLAGSRVVVIPKFKVSRDTKPSTNMKGSDIPNALASLVRSTSTTVWYGTLDEYMFAVGEGGALFEYSFDSNVTFTQGIVRNGGEHATVLVVKREDKWDAGEVTLLKLDGCAIKGGNRGKRSLGDTTDQNKVKTRIAKNRYPVYGWAAGIELTGYTPGETTKVVFTKNPKDCVFFDVGPPNPTLSLING